MIGASYAGATQWLCATSQPAAPGRHRAQRHRLQLPRRLDIPGRRLRAWLQRLLDHAPADPGQLQDPLGREEYPASPQRRVAQGRRGMIDAFKHLPLKTSHTSRAVWPTTSSTLHYRAPTLWRAAGGEGIIRSPAGRGSPAEPGSAAGRRARTTTSGCRQDIPAAPYRQPSASRPTPNALAPGGWCGSRGYPKLHGNMGSWSEKGMENTAGLHPPRGPHLADIPGSCSSCLVPYVLLSLGIL